MLEARCKNVLRRHIENEYGNWTLDLENALVQAFENGTEASKHGRDASLCPYSAVSDPERFLAWVEGFKCCSMTRYR